MHVVYNGEDLGDHGYNGGRRLSLREERRVKDMTRLSGIDFYAGLAQQDPYALSALVVVMLARRGEHTKLEQVDGSIDLELNEREKDEAAEQETQATHPLVTQILRDLGVEVDKGEVADVVRRRVRESQGLVDEGNGGGGDGS